VACPNHANLNPLNGNGDILEKIKGSVQGES